MKELVRPVLRRLLFLWLMASGLAACSVPAAIETELTFRILSGGELDKVIGALDCSRCMHRASVGQFAKTEDVEAICQWLSRAPLVVLAAGASEKEVVKSCLPPPEPFYPEDFECYSYSQVKFREQIVLRDDSEFSKDDVFRTFNHAERYIGVTNGVRIIPGHQYLVFSRRDETNTELADRYRIAGTQLGLRLDTRYGIEAACDLEQQPLSLELLNKGIKEIEK